MTTISQTVEVVTVTASRFEKPQTSHFDRAAYLVGTPIAHSQSPGLHHAIYSSMGKNWGQVLAETDDLPGFIDYLRHDERSMGSGVTMPYKVAVIPYLDDLTEEGKAVGAINTIFYKSTTDGKRRFIGTNTDVIGIRDAFLNNAVRQQYSNKPGLVVGGGGTCRAAIHALRDMLGCSPIYVVNRDKSEVDAVINEFRSRNAAQGLIHVDSEQQAQSLPSPAAVVSAVPDFEPVTDGEKLARAILNSLLERGESDSPLLEMCYHPSPNTEISRLASKAGWQVIGGIEAMIGQGIAQASLWTGIQPDQDMRDQIRRKVRENLAKAA